MSAARSRPAPLRRARRHAPDPTTAARRIARWGTGELAPELDAELDAYIDRCYADNQAVPTLRNKRVQLRQMLAEDGPELTPQACREHAERHGLAQSTTRGYMTTARNFTRWLYDTGRRELDPWDGVKMPRKSKPKPKPFTRAEAESLIDRAPGFYREWFTLAYFAGLRAKEISLVSGRDLVDGPNGPELYVPNAKGGVENSVPAHERVVELLQGKPAGRLYPSTNAESVSGMSLRVLRELGVEHGGIHRFRHTFGTELYFATHDIRLVQAMMRHESIEATLGYVMLDDRRHRAALDAL